MHDKMCLLFDCMKNFFFRTRRDKRKVFLMALFLCSQFFGLSFIGDWKSHRTSKLIVEPDQDMYTEHHQIDMIARVSAESKTGCALPKIDHYAIDVMKTVEESHPRKCHRKDWVTCNGAQCQVIDEILLESPDLQCYYKDMYDNITYGSSLKLIGDEKYYLSSSDHVKVSCTKSQFPLSVFLTDWSDVVSGIRPVKVKVPRGQEFSVNILIICIRSVSHNDFIRRLPMAHNFFTIQLGATVLKKYNVIGGTTSDNLHVILVGRPELQRRESKIVFELLRKSGYQTAYFDDSPQEDSFEKRYTYPIFADHDLKALSLKETDCIESRYDFMLEKTKQFIKGTGKRFGFTVISKNESDSTAGLDTALTNFLRSLESDGTLKNTFVIVMGDRGARHPQWWLKNAHQRQIEERLPYIAVYLPEKLKKARPKAQKALKANVNVLTSPFDVHATILDAAGRNSRSHAYRVPGSKFPRALSVLTKIDKSRSCVDADISAHWCACFGWRNVSDDHPLILHASFAMANFINNVVTKHSQCHNRSLISIQRVLHKTFHNPDPPEIDDYGTIFHTIEYFQVLVIMGPGFAVYEGTVIYMHGQNLTLISDSNVVRIDERKYEPKCVEHDHTGFCKYCNLVP